MRIVDLDEIESKNGATAVLKWFDKHPEHVKAEIKITETCGYDVVLRRISEAEKPHIKA